MFSFKNFLMATLLIFAASIGEIAEAGIITDRLPFYCYVDHKVNTYREPNGQIVGYISADEDLVRVTQVRSDGWAYGDYPISGGKRIARWFRVSEICADPGYSNRGTNVRGAQTVFRLPNSNVQFGSVSNNESVIVLADNGNRAQILYRLNNGQGYKVGWVSSSSVRNGGGNITNIKGDANNDGKVTQEDVNLIQRYIVGNVGDSAINKNNADFNGDGQINIFDMSAILSKIKNNSNVTPGARNPFSNGWYKIHPIHDLGRYVDAAGGNYNVHMWDNAEVPQQKFYLQDRGNGYFSLKSGHGDFYITAAGNGNGANLYVRSWAGSDSQLFKVVDAGNNSYHVVPKFNEHLNWDCAGAGRANGNNVQLWKSEDKDWHKWRFESTSAPQNPSHQPSNKLQELVNRWVGQTWSDHTYSQDSKQCKEFASYIFNELYGVRTIGSGSTETSSTSHILENVPSRVHKLGTLPSNGKSITAENIRELFRNAKPGDFVQMRRSYKNSRGYYSPHSAIVFSVTNDGVELFEANAKNITTNKYIYNKVLKQYYSYSKLAEMNQGISVYSAQ